MKRVYLVDDDDVVRDALAFLLRTRDLDPVCFASGDAFLDALNSGDVDTAQAGCVVLDVRMPGTSGLGVFDALRQRGLLQKLPVIFLTGHGDVPMAVSSLKGGAYDFLEKPFSDNDLVDRIEQAVVFSESQMAADIAQQSVHTRLESLTTREREVMDQILAGKYNKVIADDLGISMRTVEVHRARIFAKMGVRTAVELANLLNG